MAMLKRQNFSIYERVPKQSVKNDNLAFVLTNNDTKTIVYTDLKQEVRYRIYKKLIQLVHERFEKGVCTYHTFKVTKYITSVLISEIQKVDF